MSIIFAIIFNIIQYYYRKQMTKVGLENQKINSAISHRYIDYLRSPDNCLIQNQLNSELEQNYMQFQKIYLSQAKFNGAFNFFEGIIHNLIYLILIMIGCYLIVEYQSINIGQLTFLISLISMMSGAFNGLCEFVTKRIEYVQMSEIYKNFIMLENHPEIGQSKIDVINKISFNNKALLSGKTCKVNHEIINSLLLESETNNQLLINDIEIINIDIRSYLQHLFVINYDTKLTNG
jgi:ABC-type bacteriocin/lantibiotic exporter with double-glycine peptidase domain